jgi:hypothetical protein
MAWKCYCEPVSHVPMLIGIEMSIYCFDQEKKGGVGMYM